MSVSTPTKNTGGAWTGTASAVERRRWRLAAVQLRSSSRTNGDTWETSRHSCFHSPPQTRWDGTEGTSSRWLAVLVGLGSWFLTHQQHQTTLRSAVSTQGTHPALSLQAVLLTPGQRSRPVPPPTPPVSERWRRSPAGGGRSEAGPLSGGPQMWTLMKEDQIKESGCFPADLRSAEQTPEELM